MTSDDWWERLYADENEAPAKAPDSPPQPRGPRWRPLRARARVTAQAEPEPTPAPAGRQAVDEDELEPEPEHRPRRTRSGKAGRGSRAQHPATADPRRSLIDAWDAVPHRVRRLLANSAAAGLGWTLGLVDFTQDICVWVHEHGPADWQSILWFCVAAACLTLRRRFRDHSPPMAWLASVPIASAVLGVLLYAPTT